MSPPPPNTTPPSAPHLAIIGAGPVGLALALRVAQGLPHACLTVFDARASDHPVADDPRTLALSLGSIQVLKRLGVWNAMAPACEAIAEVHVSQQQPALLGAFLGPAQALAQRLRSAPDATASARPLDPEPTVTIHARDQAVPQLGAVARYGRIVAPLQSAWLAACAREPHRLTMRFGIKVSGLKALDDAQGHGVELDTDIAERFDAAVIAEGGVFAEQDRKGIHRDYRQTAWVGTVTLAQAHRGVAYERFTPYGPAALLPLPASEDGQPRSSLVWCVPTQDDPVRSLNDAQRLTVLNTIFPDAVGTIVALSPLKNFPLGLNAERTLVRGRSVRIGNAAQTLHPVAGQGLNLGLRDAMELVQALQKYTDIDLALKQVEWQRAPDRWSLIATTDFLARSFTWPLPGLTTLRGLGLATLQMAGPLKSVVAQQMMFGRR